jgi:hypothetical protein
MRRKTESLVSPFLCPDLAIAVDRFFPPARVAQPGMPVCLVILLVLGLHLPASLGLKPPGRMVFLVTVLVALTTVSTIPDFASDRLRWVGQALSRDEKLVQLPRYSPYLCKTAAIEFH